MEEYTCFKCLRAIFGTEDLFGLNFSQSLGQPKFCLLQAKNQPVLKINIFLIEQQLSRLLPSDTRC